MPKLKLLILDACVVIYVHELGIWQQVIQQCDVHLSRIVAENEVLFQPDDEGGYGDDIDLTTDISSGAIQIFDVTPSQLSTFKNQFDQNYLAKLDDGEAESLAYLCRQQETFLIASADAIVFRVLGNLARGDQGISLEEILQQIGLGRTLKSQFTKEFRERWTREGQTDMIQGKGRTL